MQAKKRLIDADGLRKRILAFATGMRSEVLHVDTVIMLLTQMQDVEPVRRWIPVAERLPECGNLVLAIDCDGLMSTAYYVGRWHGMLDENAITHWMPLPELPEEEKHE